MPACASAGCGFILRPANSPICSYTPVFHVKKDAKRKGLVFIYSSCLINPENIEVLKIGGQVFVLSSGWEVNLLGLTEIKTGRFGACGAVREKRFQGLTRCSRLSRRLERSKAKFSFQRRSQVFLLVFFRLFNQKLQKWFLVGQKSPFFLGTSKACSTEALGGTSKGTTALCAARCTAAATSPTFQPMRKNWNEKNIYIFLYMIHVHLRCIIFPLGTVHRW